jgi:hypothetical protein
MGQRNRHRQRGERHRPKSTLIMPPRAGFPFRPVGFRSTRPTSRSARPTSRSAQPTSVPPGRRLVTLADFPWRRSTFCAARAAPGSAAAAPAATTAAAGRGRGRRRGRATTAGDGDSGQQFGGVAVTLRAGCRGGSLPHRTADLEGGAARAAPELITRHRTSVGPVQAAAHEEFPSRCRGVVHRPRTTSPSVVSGG